MVGLDLRDIAQTASGEWVTLHGGLFHADQELTPLSEPPDLQDAPRRITREITPVVAFNEPTIGAPETARVQEIVFEVVEQCNWVAGRLREFLIPNGQPGPHNWPVI